MAAADRDREEIFYEALDIPDPAQRAAYLDEACGADPDLRARVEALLRAHDRAGDFLKTPAVAGETAESSAPLEGPGTVIGHYELLELTGEGGMGLVYLAEQKEPVRRRVAFKIIKPGMDSKQVIARFAAERQALAVLDHPNIAHVFDAGTTDRGRPYFVMEYVRGMSITRYCDEHKLTIEQRLRLFEQVCEAVQHAHQKGIIHRDLKPSNILVSVHGDRAVPKIIDFGIAKAITQPLTDKTFATLEGHLLGTPAYMSPEQVDPATQDIDTRSDIYSLGVVLYELLAGVLPFETEVLERASLAQIQQTIREMEPVLPSLRLTGLGEQAQAIAAHRGTQVLPLARRLHRELEWIPLKAMRKDRCRRYKSASDMADDVHNYLNGNPLLAGPETTIYRVQKFVHKHAGSVATVALVAAAIVLGLVVSTWQATVATNAKNRAIRSEVEKDRQAQIALEERDKALVAQQQAVTAQQQAEEQRQRAEASEDQAQRLLYAANMNLTQHACEQNNFGRLRQLLGETASYPRRGFEWYYWQRQAHPEIRTLRGHNAGIYSVAFSPDGRRIAAGSDDGVVKIWDVATGRELMTLRDPDIEFLAFSPCLEEAIWTGNAGVVAFSPDGQRLASSSRYGTAKVWDAASGKELFTLPGHELAVGAIAFSPDGQRIVTGSYDETAKVWDANNGEELLTLPAASDVICSVSFSPDGHRIITSGAPAKVWDAASGEELLTFPEANNIVWSVDFSPDNRLIVTANIDGPIQIWEAATGEELLTLPARGQIVCSVKFSPDSQRILATGYMTATVWDIHSGTEVFTLKGHSDVIYSGVFSPDGQQIATGSNDRTVKIWNATVSRERILRGHSRPVKSVAFSPDGQKIVTGSDDGTARIWETVSGQELLNLDGHGHKGVIDVAFSPDGQRILTGGEDKTARVWEAATGNALSALEAHKSSVFGVTFSPDGRRIATASYDGTAKIWDANSGKELFTMKGHDAWVQSVAFSSDGRQIVTAGRDKTAKIWEADSGREVLTLRGHDKRVWFAVFSPAREQVLTVSDDRTGKIWDATTGRELLTLRGHGGPVRSAAFSPDGRQVVTSSYDKTAKLWDVDSGKELLTLKGDTYVCSVAFSPDGQRIVTGNVDGTARIWEAASLEQGTAWENEETIAAERAVTFAREQATKIERYAVLRMHDPGAIKRWLVLAPLPFDRGDEDAVSAALDQQQILQEGTLRPRAGEQIRIGETERVWEAVQLEDNLLDFNRLLGGPTDYSVAYAVCYVYSERAQADLLIGIGTCDCLKVYLNGRGIYRREWWLQNYSWRPAEVPGVELRAGLNVLVLKVVNQTNDWRASIRIADMAGQPVKGIRVTLEPPEEVQR